MVFGTCSSGRYPVSVHYSYHINCGSSKTDEDLHKSVKEFFSLDSLGIIKSEKPIISSDDERALNMMRSLTTLEEDRYRTGMPWKYDDVRMPNSKSMAMKRLLCLERRMAREPELAKALRHKMNDYVEKGYARKLTLEELEQPRDRIWYLPVFPVFNPNKPGKLRIVWDAAAEVNGVSLNAFLLKGPDQLTELPSVLYKFREHLVAIGGDIREMFHQVQMIEDDQHCLRFLWRTEDAQDEPDVYVLAGMSFGATCSPSCAQFVMNEKAERFRSQFPAAVDVIQKAHYVDDMLTSVETEDDAIELAQQVKQIHSHAGFEMRNWVSNSRKVLKAMGEEQVSEKSMDIASEMANEKVLGMWWSTSSDTFTYKMFTQRNEKILLEGKRPTKRELLRTMMSIYDPLGMIAHYLMFVKVLLQDVWRSGVSWDECIADREWEKWQTWLRFLPNLESLQIPRCYRLSLSIGLCTNIQLHTSVDASEEGYAAVCYFRFEERGQVECALIGAKSRVAPLKFTSIPRLELQAAVVGSRLASNIQQGHTYNINKPYFWTDARDVLCWLKSDHRRYSPFVAFRVSELLESTEFSEWRWVPTRLNVADEATKWKRVPNLDFDSRWFKAPDFLWQSEDRWPEFPSLGPTNEELRPKLLHHTEKKQCIVTLNDYTQWKTLLQATARALRSSKGTVAVRSSESDPLTRDDLREAANYLYREAQEDIYPEERRLLTYSKPDNAKKVLPKKSPLFKLEPFVDDEGVLRLRGRLSACNLIDETQKHPIILPRQHLVTHLVVKQVHEDFHHQCHQTVLNEIRSKFYVPRLRVVYGKVRRNCQECQILLAKPDLPAMADLPRARLAAFIRPFSFMGLDYFGPMQVTVGRRVEKRWGVLATCLTTRAVHIELAHTLTTASCIMILRNIMSRRGVPIEIISDRGTNLVGTSKELKKALEQVDENRLMSEFTTEETKWSFNPPASPHMGGSWERLIQSVKKILIQILPTSHHPTDEVLRNTLVEIENIINSRPLTYVAVDNESSPALTPNDILVGSSNGLKPLVTYDDSGSALRAAWKSSQVLANIFWKRWLAEYLPEITRRSKWFKPARPIQVGDEVIIVDSNFPRNCWPRGRVIGTKPSNDGQVRSATVQTNSGVYERPAVRLAVLDVSTEKSEPDKDPATGGAVAYIPDEKQRADV
ncbi:uncharacterized protein LOC129761071 [Toxorhynchites rutilus septentrionalis]|uniref:uncharacterized protein LOC129761071 n=1 Tax=Toxorhynchites rutilus septentrionalis TaxID=329112 RepID=UPI00247A3E1C|nr:uncharacterized protein LOC129761071 [Toxorhynchites rutilus septentrionalis]